MKQNKYVLERCHKKWSDAKKRMHDGHELMWGHTALAYALSPLWALQQSVTRLEDKLHDM